MARAKSGHFSFLVPEWDLALPRRAVAVKNAWASWGNGVER